MDSTSNQKRYSTYKTKHTLITRYQASHFDGISFYFSCFWSKFRV